MSSKTEGYHYVEPSDLEEIRSRRKAYDLSKKELSEKELFDKIHGAWMGRICGCMLGKTVESIMTDELHPFLKETGNFPMHRYIKSTDVTNVIGGEIPPVFVDDHLSQNRVVGVIIVRHKFYGVGVLSISHIKNGIYGEMFIAAMLACAAVSDDMEAIILGGLAEIPCQSRLYGSMLCCHSPKIQRALLA